MSEFEQSIPVMSKDEIIASYKAASGSLQAQALYLIGWGAVHGVNGIDDLVERMVFSNENLQEEDKRMMRLQMDRSHRGNTTATETTRLTRQLHARGLVQDVVASQFPNQRSVKELVEMIAESGIEFSVVYAKVKDIFLHEKDLEVRAEHIKEISAYLNLFRNLEWWNALDPAKKAVVKQRGESLLFSHL